MVGFPPLSHREDMIFYHTACCVITQLLAVKSPMLPPSSYSFSILHISQSNSNSQTLAASVLGQRYAILASGLKPEVRLQPGHMWVTLFPTNRQEPTISTMTASEPGAPQDHDFICSNFLAFLFYSVLWQYSFCFSVLSVFSYLSYILST